MRPRERATADEGDLLRARLDQIIGMRHPLVALARKLDWAFIEKTFGEIYSDGPGQPLRPTRLMAGLIITSPTRCFVRALGEESEDLFSSACFRSGVHRHGHGPSSAPSPTRATTATARHPYKFGSFIAGQRRRITPKIKREMCRRSCRRARHQPNQGRGPHGP